MENIFNRSITILRKNGSCLFPYGRGLSRLTCQDQVFIPYGYGMHLEDQPHLLIELFNKGGRRLLRSEVLESTHG